MEPQQVIELRVHLQFVHQSFAVDQRRRLVQFHREIVRALVRVGNGVSCGQRSDRGIVVGGSDVLVVLPGAAEEIGVVAEAGAELIGAAGEAAVVDENVVLADRNSIVGGGVDPDELERSDDGRVGGNAVEADIGLGVGDECEEIGVSAGAGEVLGPRGAPGKDQSALDGDVEGGGVGLAVVVVVDGEGADVVAAGGQIGDDVAILLAGGEGEVAEGLLLGVAELEGLGDDGGGAASEEAVGEPRGVEWVDGVGGATAVYVVGESSCERKKK